MLRKFTQFFICQRLAAIVMPFAVLLVVLLSARQSASQPALNVWRSNGPNADVRKVVVDPFNANVVYAGSFSGVFKSVNNGASWFLVNPMSVRDLSVDYVNPNTLYAATGGGVFKSTNGGINWNNLNAPDNATKVQVSQTNPNLIVAAGWSNGPPLYYDYFSVSTNGGASWDTRQFSSPIPETYPRTFEFDPRNPNNIYLYVQGYDDIGLFKSNNGGASWEPFYYTGGIFGTGVYFTSAFKVNSDNPNIVYASAFTGLVVTTDGGTNWSFRGNPGDSIDLEVVRQTPQTFYAATVYELNGMRRSADDGMTWSAFNDGLTNYNINDLALDHSNRFLHAATTTGVFSVQVRADSPTDTATSTDFDGDGRADISVFRPSDRTWYLNQSTDGFSAIQFGLSTDKITPADFDGDGKTDISVFRDGAWYWLNSYNGNFNALQFGTASDIPVPADFTGDGRSELAVYRKGDWFTLNLANGQFQAVQFGLATDQPIVADYDGDNRADYAVFRNGSWYLLRSTQGFAAIHFGFATDKPVPADYDGDGKNDIAVFRNGVWYLQQSNQGFAAFQFGLTTDTPAPADYDGDGRADAAVFRDSVWYFRQSTNGFAAVQFGLPSDRPVPSAYLP